MYKWDVVAGTEVDHNTFLHALGHEISFKFKLQVTEQQNVPVGKEIADYADPFPLIVLSMCITLHQHNFTIPTVLKYFSKLTSDWFT